MVAHHNRSQRLKDFASKAPNPIRRIIIDNRSSPEHVAVLRGIDAELWERPNFQREAGAYCEYLSRVLSGDLPRPKILMLTQDDWGVTPMSRGWEKIHWDRLYELFRSGASVVHQQNVAGYTSWKPDDVMLTGVMDRYFGGPLELSESILTATFVCRAEPLLRWYEEHQARIRDMMFTETRFAWLMERLWQQPFATGRWVQVHEDGRTKIDREFCNGKPHGVWKRFSKDGKPISEISFDSGTPHGEWKYWHAAGPLMCSMTYKCGKKVGKETGWDDKGVMQLQVDWDAKGG